VSGGLVFSEVLAPGNRDYDAYRGQSRAIRKCITTGESRICPSLTYWLREGRVSIRRYLGPADFFSEPTCPSLWGGISLSKPGPGVLQPQFPLLRGSPSQRPGARGPGPRVTGGPKRLTWGPPRCRGGAQAQAGPAAAAPDRWGSAGPRGARTVPLGRGWGEAWQGGRPAGVRRTGDLKGGAAHTSLAVRERQGVRDARGECGAPRQCMGARK